VGLTSLIFLGAFLVGCSLALVRHPLYGLVTYIAVFYLHPPSAWWGAVFGGVRWSLLAAAVTLVAVWIHGAKLGLSTGFWRHRIPWLYLLLVVWLTIQLGWAIVPEKQWELLILYAKYLVLLYVVFRILNSERAIRVFLWSHVAGTFYMGWTAFTSHLGGRFEGFRGPDISEANAGALTLATGFFVIGTLFLASKWRGRAGLAGVAPFLLDGLVRTASRGGFLALTLGGAIFSMLAPSRHRKLIYGLGAVAALVFLLLTNPQFWARIGTIQYLGEQVEGTDTGAGRLLIIAGQIRMFKDDVWGWGHRATPYLSSLYMREEDLPPPRPGERPEIASHNTFMSLLVEQGIPGALFYVAIGVWTFKRLAILRRRLKGSDSFGELVLAGVGAAMGAIFAGDMFVDYLKLEVRVWFIAVVMAVGTLWLGGEPSQGKDREGSAGEEKAPATPVPYSGRSR